MSARQDGPELTEIVYDASPGNTSLKLAILRAQTAWQESFQSRLRPRQKTPVPPAPVVRIHPPEATYANATRDTRDQTEARAALALRASTKISVDQLNARRARSILTRLQPAAAFWPAGATPAAAVVTVGPARSAVLASSKQHPGLHRALNVDLESIRPQLEQQQTPPVRHVLWTQTRRRGATAGRTAGAMQARLATAAGLACRAYRANTRFPAARGHATTVRQGGTRPQSALRHPRPALPVRRRRHRQRAARRYLSACATLVPQGRMAGRARPVSGGNIRRVQARAPARAAVPGNTRTRLERPRNHRAWIVPRTRLHLPPAAAFWAAGATPAAAVVTVGPARSAVLASSKQHPGLHRALNVSRGNFRLTWERCPAACARRVRRAPHPQQGALHLLLVGAKRGQLGPMVVAAIFVRPANIKQALALRPAACAVVANSRLLLGRLPVQRAKIVPLDRTPERKAMLEPLTACAAHEASSQQLLELKVNRLARSVPRANTSTPLVMMPKVTASCVQKARFPLIKEPRLHKLARAVGQGNTLTRQEAFHAILVVRENIRGLVQRRAPNVRRAHTHRTLIASHRRTAAAARLENILQFSEPQRVQHVLRALRSPPHRNEARRPRIAHAMLAILAQTGFPAALVVQASSRRMLGRTPVTIAPQAHTLNRKAQKMMVPAWHAPQTRILPQQALQQVLVNAMRASMGQTGACARLVGKASTKSWWGPAVVANAKLVNSASKVVAFRTAIYAKRTRGPAKSVLRRQRLACSVLR